MNPLVDTDAPSNFLNTTTNANNGVRSDANLGRLNISRIDGDTDADGKIDDIRMLGTRSMSIWEKQPDRTLLRVSDTGSFFETHLRDFDSAGWVDGRSHDKGSEPEGLTLGAIDGHTFAFVGMERTNGIFMFDITNPLVAPQFVDYIRINTGDIPLRPERLRLHSGGPQSHRPKPARGRLRRRRDRSQRASRVRRTSTPSRPPSPSSATATRPPAKVLRFQSLTLATREQRHPAQADYREARRFGHQADGCRVNGHEC